MSKASEYRELEAEALDEKIRQLEANLFNQRFQASMGKLENVATLRLARRDIARAKTVLRQKRAGAGA